MSEPKSDRGEVPGTNQLAKKEVDEDEKCTWFEYLKSMEKSMPAQSETTDIGNGQREESREVGEHERIPEEKSVLIVIEKDEENSA